MKQYCLKAVACAMVSCVIVTLDSAVYAASPETPVEVRVRPTAGGPQLFVDGVAVRPRWVYPSHGTKLVMSEKEPTRYSFDFTVGDASSTLRVLFAFNKILRGKERATVVLRDISVTAADGTHLALTNGWRVIDNGSTGEGTIGAGGTLTAALHPSKKVQDYGSFAFDVWMKAPAKGRCTLSFETYSSGGQPVYPRVSECNKRYNRALTLGEDDGDSYDKTIRLASAAEVNILTPPMSTCWYPPERPQDWKAIDGEMRHVISVNPKALIVPRVGINMPDWMLKAHPEWSMRNELGERLPKGGVSSRPYRAAAVAHVEKLARHLQEAFPRNFAGLHVCGQSTGEWIYFYSDRPQFLGYDVPTRDAFREWLAQLGEKDAATAEVPSGDERRQALVCGAFHDPVRERRVMLFNAFQQLEIATLINDCGAAIRRATNGKSLSVFFYGYPFEIGNRGPESGHLGVGWLLEHGRENIDALAAPISYGDRQKWPGFANVMSPAESLARAGIMWIHEDDTRTCCEPIWDFITCCGGPKIDKPQTIRTLRRNLAQDAIRGFGCWWMDLFGRGWFADADLWQVMRDLRPLDDAMLHRTRLFSPDIACIIDERSMLFPVGFYRNGIMPMTMSTARKFFSACGAPHGQYLLSEIAQRPLDAKLRVYQVAYSPSVAARAAMTADRLAHPERVRVWCWASGLVTKNGEDLDAARTLTGFDVRPAQHATRDLIPTPLGVSRGLANRSWPTKYDMSTNLYTVTTNATDEIWATYTGGEPALVVRRHPEGGADVFAANFRFQGAEEIAAYARLAGVHRYTAPNEAAVWAAEGYTMVQALKAGEIAIDFGNGLNKTERFGLGDVKIYKDGVETCPSSLK